MERTYTIPRPGPLPEGEGVALALSLPRAARGKLCVGAPQGDMHFEPVTIEALQQRAEFTLGAATGKIRRG